MKGLVFLAELFHQTNTFADGVIGLDEFVIRGGQDMLREQGELSSVGGILEVSESEGWDLRPVISLKALSGPIVSDGVVEFFWEGFRAVAEAVVSTEVDGVFMLLHGAMVSESYDDVEGEILRRMRGLPGFSDTPICGVLDLHANFTDAMSRQADGLIAYRNSSGSDAKEAARDAAILLDSLMKTESRPTTLREHPPILWPPAVAVTNREPMISLQYRARTLESEIPDVSFINVFAGFPYSDVPEAGVSFTAISDGDIELARSALRELNVLASSRRHSHIEDLTIVEAVALLCDQKSGKTLLLEASDDVENGASGNSRDLLLTFVEEDIQDTLVVIHDPITVENLRESEPGDAIELTEDREPRSMRGELVSKEDAHAVVNVHGVTVLLIGSRTPMDSFERLRTFGIEPEDYSVVVLKSSKVLNPLDDASHWNTFVLDSPGVTPLHLERLSFKNVTRPVYPLDAV